jgi:hypothetical protein
MDIQTLLNVGGAVFGVVGIVLSWIFYRLGRRIKEPCWSIIGFNIIDETVSQVDGINITYMGHPVRALSRSELLFWNNGNTTISNEDVVTGNPFRIVVPSDTTIFRVELSEVNDQYAGLSVDFIAHTERVSISFDHLKPGKGGIITVLHNSAHSMRPAITGELKDGNRLKEMDFMKLVPVYRGLPDRIHM